MKYSSNNKPLVCMMTQSTCYKGTRKMGVKGVLWHSTGANNTSIKRYVQPDDNAPNRAELINIIGKNNYGNDWNHIDYKAGVNAFVGELANNTVAAVQTLPWDFRPWGCGSGSKGSCNDGWIQFEICEDSLTDKTYFNKIYKEACELTAYLCKMYNLDPYGYTTLNGVKVPVILCHADSCKLGLGSNHGDVLHWFKKHGKTMDDVRKDVAALMNKMPTTVTPTAPAAPSTTTQQLYRVRKSWDDVASQKGAYSNLEGAIKCCDEAGSEYHVFDSAKKIVYPKPLEVGDAVKLVEGAKYTNGQNIPNWVINSTVYVREIRLDGNIVFSTLKTGAITGVAEPKYFQGVSANTNTTTNTTPTAFKPYVVSVDTDELNVRKGAGTDYAVVATVNRGGAYTIVEEAVAKNGDKWGLLKAYEKNRNGWIALNYTKKIQ